MLSFLLFLIGTVLILFAVWYYLPKGWGTVVANAAGGLPIIGTFLANVFQGLSAIDFTQYLDKDKALALGFGVLIVNIIMRSFTDTPAFKGK